MTLAAIESKALKLSLKERGQLAAKLIASLDRVDPAEAESMWLDKAQRRRRGSSPRGRKPRRLFARGPV